MKRFEVKNHLRIGWKGHSNIRHSENERRKVELLSDVNYRVQKFSENSACFPTGF